MLRVLLLLLAAHVVVGDPTTCLPGCEDETCETAECVDGQCVLTARPENTVCIIKNSLGRCHGGRCSLAAAIPPGCTSYGDQNSCSAVSDCEWVASIPSTCGNGGCPGANCAIRSQQQIDAGFTCDNCFVNSRVLFCGNGVTPSTGICQPTSTTGNGNCRFPHPVKVFYDNIQIDGVEVSPADLTEDFQVPIEEGYLKDFSSLVVEGAPVGEIFRLPEDAIGEASQLRFECPSSCGRECEVYLVAYHCPGCATSVGNDVIIAAQEKGWELSSCAPKLHKDMTGPHPMIAMRKVLSPGGIHFFPTVGQLNFIALLSFDREMPDCTSLVPCDSSVGCKEFNGQCSTELWCAKRFSKGPGRTPPVIIANGDGSPGCATSCLRAKIIM